jgi:hypothetical protein
MTSSAPPVHIYREREKEKRDERFREGGKEGGRESLSMTLLDILTKCAK